jgi:nucleotide-binding universal stress UspA family protein
VLVARIMVVANQTLGCAELEQAMEGLGPGDVVVVVAPVTYIEGEQQWDYPPIDRYIPDPLTIAHALASARLQNTVAELSRRGIEAGGEVVDAHPVDRVRELLAAEPVDEVIVCTLPERLSRWLRMDLPQRISRATHVPVRHVAGSAGPSI